MNSRILRYLSCLAILVLVVGCTTSAVRTGSEELPILSAMEIYARISPSLAFIHTPRASGSGALIENNYVLTNAHVVWPHERVDVTFPDGSGLKEVPVAFIDYMGDLALLGPVSVDLPTLEFATREDIEVGSDVYLIGYPLESESSPVPTITRGILSRIREWSMIHLTIYQTDAAVAGGQSGGVLSTDRGEVIGISSLAVQGANFALAASSRDVLERLEQMMAGVDISGLGSRGDLSDKDGNNTQEFTIENDWDSGVFLVKPEAATPIILTAESEQDIALSVMDEFGNFIASANEFQDVGGESLEVNTKPQPYFVTVRSMASGSVDVVLESNQPLFAVRDPDDARILELNHSYPANLDFGFDSDWFRIYLDKGQKMTVKVESLMIDPLVSIDHTEVGTPVYDNDSGVGILGVNSLLTFEATQAGEHLLIVRDARRYSTGGYIVDIREASPGVVAQSFPQEEPVPDSAALPDSGEREKVHDPESVKEWSRYFGYVPDGWVADTQYFAETSSFGTPLQFGGGLWTGLGYDPNVVIARFPMPKYVAPTNIVDEMINIMKNESSAVKILSRKAVTIDSTSGENVELLVQAPFGSLRVIQCYLFREHEMWLIQCATSKTEEDTELLQKIIASFHFPENYAPEEPAFETSMVAFGFYSRIIDLWESGQRRKAREQLDLFTQFADSLEETDPSYGKVIATIGHLNSKFENYEEAIEYLSLAVSIFSANHQDSELASALNGLAWAYYLTGNYAEGEANARRAVSIDRDIKGPEDPSTVNSTHTLAMLLVGLGQYQEAERLLRFVIAQEEGSEKEDPSTLAGYLTDLSTLLKRAGKEAEAREIQDRLSTFQVTPPDGASTGGVLPAERR
jgi:S1-C subfamily serine protease/tetratricopeptide (TPR) repeat protein